MTLDSFTIKLKRLDKTLFLRKENDKYVIYRKDRQNVPREILVIREKPNYDHICKLYSMDSWRNKNMIQEMDEHNEGLDRDGDEKLHLLSDEMSKLITRSAYF